MDWVNVIVEKLKELELVGISKFLDLGIGKVDYFVFDVFFLVLRKGKVLVLKYIEVKVSILSLFIWIEDWEVF